jgi:hypothetical protein
VQPIARIPGLEHVVHLVRNVALALVAITLAATVVLSAWRAPPPRQLRWMVDPVSPSLRS